MSTTPTIKIAFDLTLAGTGDFFTINSTPLGGTAVAGSAPIAGDVLTDITSDVRSVSVRRGRSRNTDKFDAGTCSVVVDNRDRLYDPTAGTAISPYAPSLKPRKALTIEANGQAIFTGQVEDIDLDFQVDGDNTTIFKASDGLTLLNQITLAAGTSTSQFSGARIEAVLNEADWPTARRSVDDGQVTLGADVIADNTNALDYLNKVAASDPGPIFIGRDGTFTFRDRLSIQTASGATFTDGASGIPFSDVTIQYGTERLYSDIEVAYVGGTAVTSNLATREAYGISTLKTETLLSDLTQAQELSDFYASRYAEPIARVESLTVPVDALSGADLGIVLGIDLGDRVLVSFTPNGVGSALSQLAVVESIEHDISPGLHRMRLTLSDAVSGFALDFSRLDYDTLGF